MTKSQKRYKILFYIFTLLLINTPSFSADNTSPQEPLELEITESMPVELLLHSLARTFNQNITISPEVKGDCPVLSLKKLSFEEALNLICEMMQLQWKKIKDAYIVSKPSLAPIVIPEQTKLFVVKYISPEAALLLVQSLIKNKEKVSLIPELKTIKATSTPDILKQIEEALKEADSIRAKETEEEIITESITTRYLTLAAVVELVAPVLKEAEGKYSLSPKTKTITITAPRKTVAKLVREIKEKDKETAPERAKVPAIPQVMIESKLVEFIGGSSRFFNIDWSYFKIKGERFPAYTPGEQTSTEVTTGSLALGFIKAKENYLFDSLLETYITEEKAEILTAPKAAAMDGETALFNYSKTYKWWEATPYFDSEGKLTHTTYSLGEPVEVKISLEVTPQIDPEEKEVVVTLHPIVEDIIDWVEQPDYPQVKVPNVSKEELTTKLRIKDGDTIAIGGLMKKKEESRITKIPLLGSIPLLGYLFRKTDISKRRTELIIFLTVRIISPE
ncbi:MAG: hypothetical protein COZ31_03235 [Nitrospirae bacterium CG_4_10_14_3_um_filter_44_29]|uniref:Type II/III secretion system secretin-like domain-containing protein n=1 Tax=bacterium (Candidatus Ratteibacteria) CG01_land_8_20_14_3_00_40_19 TaxID=2014290 RepID=A0A2M7E7Z7_9BACT|nr:MAG: hypothetical protein COS11_05255 [bacterium (Candidatus Ratteibacteria) CG01_land_8_20_14_3_00_40_19]PIX89213.1 MAG: hypothetical protein COZ31_03235 [Nitrospirae bacterium CG_4_10_14_3_um_filter_44_29]HCG77551.1 hypothetical protein [bacterium]